MHGLRYVEVTAAAVHGLGTVDPDDPRARLTRALLRRTAAHPWGTGELKRMPGLGQTDARRTLFQLQRDGWIKVNVQQPAKPVHNGGLQQHLTDLAERGAHAAVLTDQDGLVLAHAGPLPWPQVDYLGVAAVDLSQGGRLLCLPLGEGPWQHHYQLAIASCTAAGARPLVALAQVLVRLQATTVAGVH